MRSDITHFVIPAEFIDCYQHVHYSDYLKIFESARRELLYKCDILQDKLKQKNMHLVTRFLSIEYLEELLLGDCIVIKTSARAGTTSIVFTQGIVRKPGNERSMSVVSLCRQVFVMVDGATRQKIIIPQELREKLSA